MTPRPSHADFQWQDLLGSQPSSSASSSSTYAAAKPGRLHGQQYVGVTRPGMGLGVRRVARSNGVSADIGLGVGLSQIGCGGVEPPTRRKITM